MMECKFCYKTFEPWELSDDFCSLNCIRKNKLVNSKKTGLRVMVFKDEYIALKEKIHKKGYYSVSEWLREKIRKELREDIHGN